MTLWILYVAMFIGFALTLMAVAGVRNELRQRFDELEVPSMFTQQLNRRLIEEHTRELKRFNERSTK